MGKRNVPTEYILQWRSKIESGEERFDSYDEMWDYANTELYVEDQDDIYPIGTHGEGDGFDDAGPRIYRVRVRTSSEINRDLRSGMF